MKKKQKGRGERVNRKQKERGEDVKKKQKERGENVKKKQKGRGETVKKKQRTAVNLKQPRGRQGQRMVITQTHAEKHIHSDRVRQATATKHERGPLRTPQLGMRLIGALCDRCSVTE